MPCQLSSLDKKLSNVKSDSRIPSSGCVRVGAIASLPALLQMYADEPAEQIIAKVGLDMELFEDPENDISYDIAGRLLNLCAERTGLPHFSLLLGQQIRPEDLSQVGELAIYAPTVGSALRGMILHICTQDRGGVPTLTSQNDITMLGFAIYVPMNEGACHICITSITNIYNLLRSLCGSSFTATEVRFSCSRPSDIRPYQEFFKVPLKFEAGEDTIVFPEHYLKQSLPGCNIERHNEVLDRLTTIKLGSDVDFLEELHAIVRPLVVSQCCTLDHVASILALHPRTLNRRIANSGMTLRSIVSKMRYEIAKQLLAESRISVINISTILDYSEAGVFTRAFQRWSGMTPSAWRIQNINIAD